LQPVIERLQPVVERFGALWERVAPHVERLVGAAVDGVLGLLTTLVDGLVTTILIIDNVVRGDWAGAWDELAGFARRTLDGLLNYIDRWAGDFAAGLLDAIANAIDAASGALSGFLSSLPGVNVEGELGVDVVSGLRQQAAAFRTDPNQMARTGERPTGVTGGQQQVDVNVQVDSRDDKFEVFVDERVQRERNRRIDRFERQTGASRGG
jgi:hypothetical protein